MDQDVIERPDDMSSFDLRCFVSSLSLSMYPEACKVFRARVIFFNPAGHKVAPLLVSTRYGKKPPWRSDRADVKHLGNGGFLSGHESLGPVGCATIEV